MADAPTPPPLPLTAERIRARLAGPALDDLAQIAIDHILDRPIDQLVEPEWVADQIRLALEAATSDDATRRWVQEQLRELRDSIPDGTPRDHLPGEVVEPLFSVVSRPVVFDRVLVGRLLDHDAARHLVTDILTHALTNFTDRIKPVARAVGQTVQSTRGFGRLKSLSSGVGHLGDSLLGGVSRQIESKAEQKVRTFVDEALHAAMDQVADHLCNPANADRYGGYRAHVLGVVLATDNHVIAGEIDKLDPDHLVDVAVATARSVARRDGLREELTRVVRRVMHENGGRTLRDWLSEAGLKELSEEEWRRGMQERLTTEARVFIETPVFQEWLDDLLA